MFYLVFSLGSKDFLSFELPAFLPQVFFFFAFTCFAVVKKRIILNASNCFLKGKKKIRECILFYHHLILEFAAKTCLALVKDDLLEFGIIW